MAQAEVEAELKGREMMERMEVGVRGGGMRWGVRGGEWVGGGEFEGRRVGCGV